MGFNNAGLEDFADRLARPADDPSIGANLGANKDTEDKAADYVAGLVRLKGLADYVTVNVSSPNTPGLRALQGREPRWTTCWAGSPRRGRMSTRTPVFLKIAPDLTAAEIAMIVEAASTTASTP
jgi:dihydroorotate dehydrogenase